MDPVQYSSESSSSLNIGLIVIASILTIGWLALMASGVKLYRGANDSTIKAISTTFLVAGGTIALTVILGVIEAIPNSLSGPILLAEIAILSTIFWAIVLVDAATNESKRGNDKIVWVLIILLANLLGAFLYFGIRRKSRIAELSR